MTAAGKSLARDLSLLACGGLLALTPSASARSFAGLALTLFFPGYALLRCLRAPVRLLSHPEFLHCGAASLAITPLTLRLAGLLLPFNRWNVLSLLILMSASLLVFAACRRRGPSTSRPDPPRAFAIVLIVTLLLLAPGLAIGPTPDGGETRVKGWDLNNHLAIAEAIASRGLPPTNPFLQSAAPFYYHTFFHILLGAILLLGGAGSQSYLLIALLTLLLAAVFLATFHRVVAELTGNPRVALLALPFVSLVGGFDVLPVAGLAILRGESAPLHQLLLKRWNVDGWVSNHGMLVPTFFAGFYWVPHAVAALTVFLLALMFLRKTETGWGAVGVAAACLASMAGYNGYIALGGAATLALLRGADLVRFFATGFRAGREVLMRSGLAGGLAVIFGLPVLSLYVGERGDVDKFQWVNPGILLPIQILLEFGPALLLGIAGLAAARRESERRAGLMPFLLMGAVSVPSLCFVASTGENNDLAMRISMFLWIALAALSGHALDAIFPPGPGVPRRGPAPMAAIVAVVLGSASVLWFAVGAAWQKPALPAGEVAAGRWVRSHLPPGLPVQGSPLRATPTLVYLTGHPAVLSDTWAGRLFYSDPDDFSRRMSALRTAFSSPEPNVACPILTSLGIAALVIGPPERQAFPPLSREDPWPCATKAYSNGTYRVYRLR